MRRWLLLALCLVSAALQAEPAPESLRLVAEHPVDDMVSGNLSGLARCGGEFWAVSDRDDERLYRLHDAAPVWRAEAQIFSIPPVPASGLPWGLRTRAWLLGKVRGGEMDFEGLTCDAQGTRYLVSEAHAAVLQLPPQGEPQWLELPAPLLRQARASGMLLQINGMLEGIAIDPAGQRLWLAAERERRGLLVSHWIRERWRCSGSCVLLSEDGPEEAPAALRAKRAWSKSFSGLAFYDGRLFTLERLSHRICRRDPNTGQVERCWSFAEEALTDARRYRNQPWGSAEALWIDADGAWVGVDNGSHNPRGDGEARPIVWHFAVPAGGWTGAAEPPALQPPASHSFGVTAPSPARQTPLVD